MSTDPVAHGVIGLIADACTSCMICVRECPTWCISLEAHSLQVTSATDAAPSRTRKINVLDNFAIDYGLCMYCGICVDVCPFDALVWCSQCEYDAPSRSGLVHSMTRLTDWVAPDQR